MGIVPSRLIPDYCFPAFSSVTPAFLQRIGVRALILDIDNTLVPYEIAEPTDAVREWLSALTAAGIGFAFVSNNHAPRVTRFAAGIGCFVSFDSHKPCRGALRRALAALGTTPETTCAMGDQVFTDVYAAKRLGLRTILVPPIKDKTDPFTRFKRLLERPVLRAYRRRQK